MTKTAMLARAILAAAFLATTAPFSHALALAAEPGAIIDVEISDGQLVTLSTQATSLATLVRTLCEKAGVRLRAFEAPDRQVSATYDGVPLRDVLQRLLRDETYMIGVRATRDRGDLAVAWLHVTASRVQAQAAAAPPPPPPAPRLPPPASLANFGVAPDVIVDALSSTDEAKRKAAIGQLSEHVALNPGLLDPFLATDIAATIDELAPYGFADEAMQSLSLGAKDPVNRARLDGIAKSLRLRSGRPPKKPGFTELMQQGIPH